MADPNGRRRVLVVEDEALVAMLVEDILTDLGHEVAAVAGRLAVAEQAARDLAIDLAIIDLNLNGERTYPIAEILEQRGIPFVFATGYGAAGLEGRWAHVPALQKPFQPEDLSAAIKRVTES